MMKALTLHQPWASLIARGVKTYETRSWQPPESMRGQVFAIHAGKTVQPLPHKVPRFRRQTPEWERRVAEVLGDDWRQTVPTGEVVAFATLTGWRRRPPRVAYSFPMPAARIMLQPWPVTADDWLFGDWSGGRYYWRLENIKAIQAPEKTGGWQGLWNLDTLPYRHHCYEWDEMLIEAGDPEFDACLCYRPEVN